MIKIAKIEVKNAKIIKIIPQKLNPQKSKFLKNQHKKSEFPIFLISFSMFNTKKKHLSFVFVFHTIRNENIFGLANTNKIF